MHIPIHVYAYIYIYIYIHMCIIYVYIYIYICMLYVYRRIGLFVFLQCTHIFMPVHASLCTYTYICIDIEMDRDTCTDAYI